MKCSLVLFSFLLVCMSCTRNTNRTWTALLSGSVTNIKPSSSHLNSDSYILRQTHEPLFRYDENNRIVSRILTKWTRSDEYTKFVLCPKTKMEFADKQYFNIDDIKNVIDVTWKNVSPFTTADENGCLSVNFKSPQFNFFRALTSFSASPTRPTNDPRIDLGLGPFKVDKLGINEIVLSRKKADPSKRFDSIIFKNVQTLTAQQIDDHSIQDFNLVAQNNKMPSWVPKEYAEYPSSNLRTYVLVINVPDRRIRRAIYNCLDVSQLRSAFFEGTSFHDIGSLFPVGVRGAVPKKVHQSCVGFSNLQLKRPLKFINWKPERKDKLSAIFKYLKDETGIAVEMEDISITKLGHDILTHSGYDLAIVYIQNEYSDMGDFLELFADPNKVLHSLKFPDLENKFARFKNTAEQEAREKIGIDLNNDILNEAIALPLFQLVTHVYYPKDIKLPQVGSTIHTYPEVDQIQ